MLEQPELSGGALEHRGGAAGHPVGALEPALHGAGVHGRACGQPDSIVSVHFTTLPDMPRIVNHCAHQQVGQIDRCNLWESWW